MAMFQVTSQQLKAKKESLQSNNQQFNQLIGKMEEVVQGLKSLWEGQASTAFEQAFRNDKGQMDAFYQLIESYCTSLDAIIAKYAAAEQKNLSTATTRSYR